MRLYRTLPVALVGLIAACSPPPGVSSALQGAASVVSNVVSNPLTTAVLGQLVPPPKLANQYLVPIFLKTASGGAPTLDEIKRLLAITNGAQINDLPKQGGLSNLSVQSTQALGFGVLTLGTQTVGLGGVSPYQAARMRIQNPLESGDAPIFQAASGAAAYRIQDVSSVDLRSKMPPIRNQGPRGTCVLHSTAAIVDYLYQSDSVNTIHTASVEFLDWLYQIEIKANSKSLANSLWIDNGSYPQLVHLTLRVDGNRQTSDDMPYVPAQQGYLSEDQCPYNPALSDGSPTADLKTEAERRLGAPLADAIAQGHSYKSQGAYFFPVKLDLPSLKAALAGGSPIQVSYPVYRDDWYNVTASNPYVPNLTADKAQDTANIGYHSVVIVGYRDDSSAPGGGWFIVRNSWGTNWGEQGYSYVPYDMTLNFAADTCVAQPYTAQFNAVYSVTPPSKDAPPTPAPTATPDSGTTNNTSNGNTGMITTFEQSGNYTNDDQNKGTSIDSLSIPNLLNLILGFFS